MIPRAIRTSAAATLLAACSAAPGRPAPAARPSADFETEVRDAIRRDAGDSATVEVAFRDLASGDSLLVGAHEQMHAASTMKVAVMLQLFRLSEAGALPMDDSVPIANAFRSIADGSAYTLSPADDSDSTLYARVGTKATVRELTRLMITRSSNLATNLLIDRAGPDRIRAALAELGASELHVLRGVEDNAAFHAGLNNTTSAYGLMKLLEAIASGRAASPESTREMLEILGRQEFREMIPAGVPAGVRVANKTGSITGIHHDAAIVFPAGRAPYVLVVLTRGFQGDSAAARTGRDVSRIVWRHVSGRR
jgi:beta-lactamase class A